MSTSTPRPAGSPPVPRLSPSGSQPPAVPVPPPPYPLAASIDAESPRLLQTSQEVAVPVTMVNSGGEPGIPARSTCSYHWLWLVPRELARRSRTVPYHDGNPPLSAIAPVARGDRVALQGRCSRRLCLVYWLQWDMVEEGVTWFAQVAPRQPRTPRGRLSAAGLDCRAAAALIALAGSERSRRAGAFAVAAFCDVWWCACDSAPSR